MIPSRPIHIVSSALLLVLLALASIVAISAAGSGSDLAVEVPMEVVGQRTPILSAV